MFKKIIAAMVVALFSAVTAHAQVPDGLRCHSIKDEFSQITGAMASQTDALPFIGWPCNFIKARAKMVCVPSEHFVSGTWSRDGGTIMEIGSITGDMLTFAQICYKVKCPAYDPSIGPQQMEDMLGSRQFTGFRAKMICLPAVNHSAPTTTTSTTTSTLP